VLYQFGSLHFDNEDFWFLARNIGSAKSDNQHRDQFYSASCPLHAKSNEPAFQDRLQGVKELENTFRRAKKKVS